MTRVTVWYSQNSEGAWEHNHIEDGWVTDFSCPHSYIGNKKQEVAWKNKKWKCMFAWKTKDGLVSEKTFLFYSIHHGVNDIVPASCIVRRIEKGE